MPDNLPMIEPIMVYFGADDAPAGPIMVYFGADDAPARPIMVYPDAADAPIMVYYFGASNVAVIGAIRPYELSVRRSDTIFFLS